MLTRLHTRRFPDTGICTPEQARELALIAFSCKRHLGLLIDRKGEVDMVIVGDQQSVCIPELERAREGRGRLSGLRFLHILPTDGLLTQEDIMDMIFLRLDAVIALSLWSDFSSWASRPITCSKSSMSSFSPVPSKWA